MVNLKQNWEFDRFNIAKGLGHKISGEEVLERLERTGKWMDYRVEIENIEDSTEKSPYAYPIRREMYEYPKDIDLKLFSAHQCSIPKPITISLHSINAVIDPKIDYENLNLLQYNNWRAKGTKKKMEENFMKFKEGLTV